MSLHISKKIFIFYYSLNCFYLFFYPILFVRLLFVSKTSFILIKKCESKKIPALILLTSALTLGTRTRKFSPLTKFQFISSKTYNKKWRLYLIMSLYLVDIKKTHLFIPYLVLEATGTLVYTFIQNCAIFLIKNYKK